MDSKTADNFIKTLKLTRNEWAVFNYLGYTEKKSIAEVSQTLRLPRMSTHITLNSLKDRGIVDYSRSGKRKFWYRIDPETLSKRFSSISSDIDNRSEITIGAKNTQFTVYHGADSLYKVWEALLELPSNTRVQALQPTSSIKESLKKLDWSKKVQPLQENIRNKPIIIEGLLSEDYYPAFLQLYNNDKELLLKTLESFIGRSTDMTFIKKEFLNLPTELFILPHAAYITNWKEEVSIKITNRTMINFLKELFELARGYGKHIDQNKYIKELIEKVKNTAKV